MDWKAALSKFNLKPDIKTKGGRWLVMLAVGLICLILACRLAENSRETGRTDTILDRPVRTEMLGGMLEWERRVRQEPVFLVLAVMEAEAQTPAVLMRLSWKPA